MLRSENHVPLVIDGSNGSVAVTAALSRVTFPLVRFRPQTNPSPLTNPRPAVITLLSSPSRSHRIHILQHVQNGTSPVYPLRRSHLCWQGRCGTFPSVVVVVVVFPLRVLEPPDPPSIAEFFNYSVIANVRHHHHQLILHPHVYNSVYRLQLLPTSIELYH